MTSLTRVQHRVREVMFYSSQRIELIRLYQSLGLQVRWEHEDAQGNRLTVLSAPIQQIKISPVGIEEIPPKEPQPGSSASGGIQPASELSPPQHHVPFGPVNVPG